MTTVRNSSCTPSSAVSSSRSGKRPANAHEDDANCAKFDLMDRSLSAVMGNARLRESRQMVLGRQPGTVPGRLFGLAPRIVEHSKPVDCFSRSLMIFAEDGLQPLVRFEKMWLRLVEAR